MVLSRLQRTKIVSLQPETKFKKKLKEELKKIPKAYFEKIQQVGLRGTPDMLGVVNGRSVALELKVDAPIEPLQTYKLRKWARAGAYVAVITPKNMVEILDDLHHISVGKPVP